MNQEVEAMEEVVELSDSELGLIGGGGGSVIEGTG